jgi:hypothetical protein
VRRGGAVHVAAAGGRGKAALLAVQVNLQEPFGMLVVRMSE